MFQQFKSSPAASSSLDASIKSSLLLRLKECVSELLMRHTSERQVPLRNEEATNSLCWIIEAVFIHGLKNTFLKSLFKNSSYPNPSFYEFVLIFSHRELIEGIRRLNYINTDVGRSRAWIRLTLNEMSLLSYLENMLRNPSYIRSFYRPSAFLRDQEKCDILKNYLVGIETCRFELVVDNSLLNQWTSGVLSLVGLWVDDGGGSEFGVDVVNNLESRDLQAIPQLGKCKTPEPEFIRDLRRTPLLGEDDALRIIMQGGRSGSRRNSGEGKFHPSSNSHVVDSYSTHWPTKTVKEDKSIFENKENQNEANSQQPKIPPKEEEEQQLSYVELLTAYNTEGKIVGAEFYGGGSPMEKYLDTGAEEVTVQGKQVEDQNKSSEDEEGSGCGSFGSDTGICTTFEETTATVSSGLGDNEQLPVSQQEPENDEFDIITTFSAVNGSPEMFNLITKFAGRIATEVGMDEQQYTCKFCRAPIGMSFAPARVCYLTGNYFCNSCHVLDTGLVPSRIILNWDFNTYSMCKLGHDFLVEIKDQPLFDLEKINPKLYSFIDELAELRDIRKRLNYVSMYLKTCKDDTIFQDFKNQLNSKDHMFDDIHLYSVTDLVNVTNRSLISPLTKLLKFGTSHIISCKICKAKGFVCEVCKNPEVIFPFNLESIFKCLSCGAVYHDKCMNNAKPCPRCQRWKEKEIFGNDFCDE